MCTCNFFHVYKFSFGLLADNQWIHSIMDRFCVTFIVSGQSSIDNQKKDDTRILSSSQQMNTRKRGPDRDENDNLLNRNRKTNRRERVVFEDVTNIPRVNGNYIVYYRCSYTSRIIIMYLYGVEEDYTYLETMFCFRKLL